MRHLARDPGAAGQITWLQADYCQAKSRYG